MHRGKKQIIAGNYTFRSSIFPSGTCLRSSSNRCSKMRVSGAERRPDYRLAALEEQRNRLQSRRRRSNITPRTSAHRLGLSPRHCPDRPASYCPWQPNEHSAELVMWIFLLLSALRSSPNWERVGSLSFSAFTAISAFPPAHVMMAVRRKS